MDDPKSTPASNSNQPAAINELMELAEAHARRIILGEHKALMPIWTLIDQKSAMHFIGTPWQNPGEKEQMKKMLATQIKRKGIKAYSFLCEAWFYKATAQEWAAKELMPPAQHPTRRECVLIIAKARGEPIRHRILELFREPNGTPASLEPTSQNPDGLINSWMNELL